MNFHPYGEDRYVPEKIAPMPPTGFAEGASVHVIRRAGQRLKSDPGYVNRTGRVVRVCYSAATATQVLVDLDPTEFHGRNRTWMYQSELVTVSQHGGHR